MTFHSFALPRETRAVHLLEVILGLAAITFVNFMLFRNNMGFVGTTPHPYWLVVLPVAARYGFKAGLSAGVLSAALALGLAFPARMAWGLSGLGDLFFGDPLGFILAGLILGEIREVHKRQHAELASLHADQSREMETLKTHYQALVLAKQEIDGRIITQEQTLSTLRETAQALDSLQEDELYPAVLDILVKYLGAEAASIYAMKGDRLVLAASTGQWENRCEAPVMGVGLVGRALSGGQAVSADAVDLSVGGEENPDVDALIAAPVRGDKGRILGVLAVERLPFVKFNEQTMRMTALVAGWCGDALENALLYKRTKARTIDDEITGAYTADYLEKRLDEEISRSRRYKTPLGVLVLESAGLTDLDEQARTAAMADLNMALKQVLRNLDLVFHSRSPGQYIVVMPGTPLAGCRVVREKLRQAIEALSSGEEARISHACAMGVSEYGVGVKAPMDLVDMALAELKAAEGNP